MWFLTRSTRPRRTTVLAWDALLSAVAATGPLAADVSGPACATGDRVLRVVRGGSRIRRPPRLQGGPADRLRGHAWCLRAADDRYDVVAGR